MKGKAQLGPCRIEGCAKIATYGKNGYCAMHITRIRKNGSPGPVGPTRLVNATASEKFFFYGWTVDENGCWLWARETYMGYGDIYAEGRAQRAHRVSYEIHKGPIPAGSVVCHTCDVPRCVNPDHLFLGTQAENMADMYVKRRHTHGEKMHASKLTESEVLEICRLKKAGVSAPDLAERFGVHKRQIYKLVNGEQWKHLSAG